ncbi:MAG: hypothetical protein ITG00_07460 [Flavobacterium sp.]|nr:hypothetical protein [Flavobacterium sp.]
MAEFIFIGDSISFPALRDFIFTHKIDAGDTVVLNALDFDRLLLEIKASGEELPDIPMTLLGVLITKDSTDTIPAGKIQIVKNEQPYH